MARQDEGDPLVLLAAPLVFFLAWCAGYGGVWGAGLLLATAGLGLALGTMRFEDPFWQGLFAVLSGGPLRLPGMDDGERSMRPADAPKDPAASFKGWTLLGHPGLYWRMAGVALMAGIATGLEFLVLSALLDSPAATQDRFTAAFLAEFAASGLFAAMGAVVGFGSFMAARLRPKAGNGGEDD